MQVGDDEVKRSKLKVILHRSQRRKKTIEAKFDAGKLHVYLPAGLPAAKEREWVEKMVQRVERKFFPDDEGLVEALEKRAQALNRLYFKGRLSWTAVKLVRPTKTRYASCNPDSKVIRVSAEIRQFPRWVQDYLLIHELAHLEEPSHSDRFWRLVGRYDKAERARGFLMGWAQRAVAEERPRQGDRKPGRD